MVPLRARRSAAPNTRTQATPRIPAGAGGAARQPLTRVPSPRARTTRAPNEPLASVEPGTDAASLTNGSARPKAWVRPPDVAPAPDADIRLVRLSVRSVVSRVDVTLPERTTFAEALEAVLDLCPASLRNDAVRHGGWVLRTAAGRVPDGESTLAAAGVLDGATLFLAGVDPRAGVAAYDDIADAVAENVLHDTSLWQAGARRAVALGAAGLFAALAILPLLMSGPPWRPVALLLAAVTVLAQVGAGLLSRVGRDQAAAVAAGMISVATGATAATVATAGRTDLLTGGGPANLLLGAIGASICATTAAVIIGAGTVPLGAVVTGGMVLAFALSCGVLLGVPAAGWAAITVGLTTGMMPLVPMAALRWAGVGIPFAPTTLEEVQADSPPIDAGEVGSLTGRAVDGVTAMIQGLAWASLAAAAVLAFTDDATARVLAGVTATGLILRARLFVTIGQRLPLLLAGIGSTAALMLAVITDPVGWPGFPWSAAPFWVRRCLLMTLMLMMVIRSASILSAATPISL